MESTVKYPFYARASLIFIGLFAFITILYIGQRIIVPIIYATIIAIVINPLVIFFVRKKLNRVFAISISLTIVFSATVLFLILIYSQLSVFAESVPKIIDKFSETLNEGVTWLSYNFNISTKKINTAILESKVGIINASKSSVGSTLSSLGHLLIILVLIPVYIFMILFYEPLLIDFIRRLFGVNNLKEVNEVLTSTKTIIQKYLMALLLEAIIIATLNSIGLLILGIDYAIILGILGAILNIIPYIGGIAAVSLPAIIAYTTKSSFSSVLLVLGLYVVIQFIDNHYISPKVVASKVKINALISIIVVLAGGALWGLPGMFLSIPLTAILKVVFDRIQSLSAWGFLLGDTMPTKPIFKLNIKPIKK